MTGQQKRVVISGMGVISPIGNELNSFTENLWAGKCGIDKITHFDVSDYSAVMAGELKDYKAEDHFDRRQSKRLDRSSQLAIIAAKAAKEHSNLDMDKEDPYRIGTIIGSGIAGLQTIEIENEKLIKQGPRRVSPLFIPMSIANMPAGNCSIAIGTKGICYAPISACASGTDAVGQAFLAIQSGRQDVVFAGGAEASITPIGIAGFQNMKALSTSQDPNRASIPFDKERDGFVMGEGAAVLVLEELEHAIKRNATIYAEVLSYAQTSDAYHITSPDVSGVGAAKAMELAVSEAGLALTDIDYINAHGTSTPYNDSIESLAIQLCFAECGKIPAVSSTKSMTGHLLGAAGALEAIVCALSVKEDKLAATINYKEPDEACGLDYVTEGTRETKVNYCLSNSLGFGGHNACVCIAKYNEDK